MADFGSVCISIEFRSMRPLLEFYSSKSCQFRADFGSHNIPTVPPHWSYFARATARPWVGHLGCFGYILVEEGLGFFLRYCGPKWVDGIRSISSTVFESSSSKSLSASEERILYWKMFLRTKKYH